MNTKTCNMCSKSLKSIMNDINEHSTGIQCSCTFLNSSEEEMCADTADKPGETDPPVECPQKECEICYEILGTDYFAMFECIHVFCNACAVKYFTNQITERPIFDCICPMCNLPDLHSNADNYVEYFSILLPCLKRILDESIMHLFEKKLTEVALSSDPNFVWCIQCTSGFVNNTQTKRIRCPDCRVIFCFDCKKKWESQHANTSCEQYANWQRDNNCELSSEAIGNYLQKNGIDCPKCKFKYDLSRGGCIHFTCTQCKYEFCFGCSTPFLRSCRLYAYCKSVALHAHHQRNCFYYLHDKTIPDLQGLLTANKIDFMVDIPQSSTEPGDQNCPIELQIANENAIVDSICENPTERGHAGLCKKHYTEYLILKVTKAKLETTSLFTVENYRELLRVQGIAIPPRTDGQKDDEYKALCEKLVRNNIPL